MLSYQGLSFRRQDVNADSGKSQRQVDEKVFVSAPAVSLCQGLHHSLTCLCLSTVILQSCRRTDYKVSAAFFIVKSVSRFLIYFFTWI